MAAGQYIPPDNTTLQNLKKKTEHTAPGKTFPGRSSTKHGQSENAGRAGTVRSNS